MFRSSHWPVRGALFLLLAPTSIGIFASTVRAEPERSAAERTTFCRDGVVAMPSPAGTSWTPNPCRWSPRVPLAPADWTPSKTPSAASALARIGLIPSLTSSQPLVATPGPAAFRPAPMIFLLPKTAQAGPPPAAPPPPAQGPSPPAPPPESPPTPPVTSEPSAKPEPPAEAPSCSPPCSPSATTPSDRLPLS